MLIHTGKIIIFIATLVNNFYYSSECLGKNIQLLVEKCINPHIIYFEIFKERELPTTQKITL